MCSIVLALGVLPGRPLVVLSNRDELLARPAGPPAIRSREGLRILSPVDLQAGGTWLAHSSARVFVGITNRFGTPPDASRRSRGEIVTHAADRAKSLEAVRAFAATLDPRAYNPFHLVVASAEGAFVAWSDGARLEEVRLEPGVHAVTERSFQEAEPVRAARLRREVNELLPSAPPLERFAALLGSNDGPAAIDAPCVHAGPYGTRSSFCLELGDDPAADRLLSTDRAPCEVPAVDRSDLLRELKT